MQARHMLLLSVCLCVRLSVCQIPVLYLFSWDDCRTVTQVQPTPEISMKFNGITANLSAKCRRSKYISNDRDIVQLINQSINRLFVHKSKVQEVSQMEQTKRTVCSVVCLIVYLSILPVSFPLSVNLKVTAVVVLTDYLPFCLSGW